MKLEQMAGQGAGVEPDDSTSTSPAQEAAKARLDDLYRVFEMFQNRGTRDAGYTSLTRGSLEAIFHRLIDSYDFTGVPRSMSIQGALNTTYGVNDFIWYLSSRPAALHSYLQIDFEVGLAGSGQGRGCDCGWGHVDLKRSVTIQPPPQATANALKGCINSSSRVSWGAIIYAESCFSPEVLRPQSRHGLAQ